MPALADEIDREQEVKALRGALMRANRSLAKIKREQVDLVEAVYTAAKDAALVVGRAEPVERPKRDRRRGEERALLHLTDVHVGQITSSFDPDVCEQRVKTAAAKVSRIAEIQRADHPVRHCTVMLGGDLVEGVQIFPGQAYEVTSGLFEQAFRCVNILEASLLHLLEGFESVEVHQVWGNHGRLGRKGEMPRDDNIDRMVCALLRERLSDQPRLKWGDDSPAWHRIIEVGNYRPLLIHGDAIRGFSGTPAFAIAKRFTAWAAGVLEPWTDGYMGHYHQEMTIPIAAGRRVFMTPSLVSDSSYATEFMGANAPPGARLHFVDPKHARVTGTYVLHLG